MWYSFRGLFSLYASLNIHFGGSQLFVLQSFAMVLVELIIELCVRSRHLECVFDFGWIYCAWNLKRVEYVIWIVLIELLCHFHHTCICIFVVFCRISFLHNYNEWQIGYVWLNVSVCLIIRILSSFVKWNKYFTGQSRAALAVGI